MKNKEKLAKWAEEHLINKISYNTFILEAFHNDKLTGGPIRDYKIKLKEYRIIRNDCIECGLDIKEYDDRIAKLTQHVACPGSKAIN